MPPTSALRRAYAAIIRREPDRRCPELDRLLVRRGVRSMSGVAIVTVLTKPYPCPGQCVYCPTDVRMPKSYLPDEPAAARALGHDFDPFDQTEWRLRALAANGHPVDKVELIVKGGTWSSYPWDYRKWFIKRCFDACNAFGDRPRAARTLVDAHRRNESAKSRVIGLTLETRPDRITPQEVVRLRELGCTRVELGVQSVDDRILKLVKRGHDAAAVALAAARLRAAGFKTDFHLMPQLPGATPASDLADIAEIFNNPSYRPDMIKIYPCVVVPQAELHGWWKEGRYRPYPDSDLIELLIAAKSRLIPRYCRISRLIRDIPSNNIVAGNMVTNLREDIQREMKSRGLPCPCLRCREIGRAIKTEPRLAAATPVLFDDAYEASGGTEHFLSFEDRRRRAVFAFCRLRLPAKDGSPTEREITALLPETVGAAFVRELHTYGHLVPIAGRETRASQHTGLGRRLMAEAEKIAAAAGYRKMAVIAGIGVRAYYRKLGYRLRGGYMMKKLMAADRK